MEFYSESVLIQMGRYDKINSSRSKNRKENLKNKNSIYIIKYLGVFNNWKIKTKTNN